MFRCLIFYKCFYSTTTESCVFLGSPFMEFMNDSYWEKSSWNLKEGEMSILETDFLILLRSVTL